jgi:site-specific DNA-methyltransferase (adenine-specific)
LNTPEAFERTATGRYRLKGFDRARPARRAAAASSPVFRWDGAELHQADCLDWLAARDPLSIHAVVTDPPYGLVEYSAKEQKKLRNGKGGVWRIPPSFDGHVRSPVPRFTVLDHADVCALVDFFYDWATKLHPVLVPGAHVIVASNPLVSYIVAATIVDAGFERRGEIVRRVMTLRGGDRPKNAHEDFPEVSVMARSMWEPWLVFRKPIEGRVQDNLRAWKTGGFRRPSADKPFGDVIDSSKATRAERRIAPHPTLKPQSFLRKLVRAVLPLGEGVLLDPFAGSGSTLAAACALDYQAIGVESDPRYVELARRAIPELAKLQADGSDARAVD